MTIEIWHANSAYKFRINPYSPRVIDRRQVKRGARWQHYQNFDTPEEARAAILQLEKDAKKP